MFIILYVYIILYWEIGNEVVMVKLGLVVSLYENIYYSLTEHTLLLSFKYFSQKGCSWKSVTHALQMVLLFLWVFPFLLIYLYSLENQYIHYVIIFPFIYKRYLFYLLLVLKNF